jgi:hypothetical protein
MLPDLGPTLLPWNDICDWLVPSQLLIKSDHLSVLSLWNWTFQEGLISSSWPWKFAQLILALGPTTHTVQLHFVILVRGLFLWEACYFPCLFRCLLLKCLSHPKLSHICHCSLYIITMGIWCLGDSWRCLCYWKELFAKQDSYSPSAI